MPSRKPPRELTVRQKHLCARNQKLVHYAIKLLLNSNRAVRQLHNADPDRVLSAAQYGLTLAAAYYVPAKGKFSTYAVAAIQQKIRLEALYPFAPVYIPPTALECEGTVERATLSRVGLSLQNKVFRNGDTRTHADELPAVDTNHPLEHDERDYIQLAIENLPDILRQTVRLRFWEDLSYRDIAKRTDNCSQEWVRKRLEKALGYLKPYLGKDTMNNLFDYAADAKRQKLRDLGCIGSRGHNDARYWQLPDARIIPEQEAFRWMEQQEKPNA